jgi:hypothetical protein
MQIFPRFRHVRFSSLLTVLQYGNTMAFNMAAPLLELAKAELRTLILLLWFENLKTS